MLVRSSLVIVLLGVGRVSRSPPGRSPPVREAHRGRELDFMAAGHYPQRSARQSRVTRAGRSRSSAGNGYLVPQPAVQVEVIALGLAGGGISDVGVQGMPVLAGLRRAI